MSKPKILFWDIETNGINARKSDLGWIICICYKWAGEKTVHTLKQTDYAVFDRDKTSDKPILKDFLKILGQADIAVAHYGDRFDEPFFNGRLLLNKLQPHAPVKQIDTCLEARKILKFAFTSKRLGYLADKLGLGNKKSDKGWPDWWHQALGGSERAISNIAKYCRQDVRTLEDVFWKLHPFMKNTGLQHIGHNRPNCPKCGCFRCQKRGRHLTTTQEYQRFQCTSCGGWFRSKHPISSKQKGGVRDL